MKSLFFALLCLTGLVVTAAAPLTRTVTQPFPPDFRGFEPRAALDVRQAAIIRAETGTLRGQEEKLRAELARRWQVDLPVLTAAEAVRQGKALLLWGENRSNMPLRRLVEYCAIESVQPFGRYEARIYPELLDYPAGVIYLGGRSMKEVLDAADRIREICPDPARPWPFFIERSDRRNARPEPAKIAAMVEKVRQHLEEPNSWIPNQTVIRLFRDAFAGFLATGRREYAEAIAAMQRIYLTNYQRNIKRFDRSGPAPSFLFHEYVWKLEIVANSPYFTAADRAAAAELMRQVAENCFTYYEMRLPMQDYAKGEQNYQTNHEIFCSRTVYFIAEHLLRHYRYEPARYWQAVAANALLGVAAQPIGPEDAAAYQYLNYQIFTTYAMASGNFDLSYFQTPAYRQYIRYCKAHYSPLGITSGYGDNPPLGNAWSFPALGTAVSVFSDPDAEALLGLIHRTTPEPAFRSMIDALNVPVDQPFRMSDELHGLQYFDLTDFTRKFNRADGLFTAPVLDKAFFRSSWQPDADFLALSGLSSASHGHVEANALLQFVDAGKIWLTDGDYLRKYPEEHSTCQISCDRESTFATGRDPSRFAQRRFAAQTADRRMALTTTTVEKLNQADWTRRIGYAARQGFWVIDEITPRRAGDFTLECRFRTLGDFAAVTPQRVDFTQKPATPDDRRTVFAILSGNGAQRHLSSRFDTGHSGVNGYYRSYPHAGPDTRILSERRTGPLAAGAGQRFVHYLQAREAGRPAPELREIAPNAWLLADGEITRLAVLGKLTLPGLEIDAASCFIGPEGLLAEAPKRLRIAGEELSANTHQLSPAVLDRLRQLRTLGQPTAVLPAAPAATAAAEPLRRMEFSAPVTALAAAPRGGFLVGTQDGMLRMLANDGTPRWEKKLAAQVSAVAIWEIAPGEFRYLAGTRPSDTATESGKAAPLHAFAADGRECWQIQIPAFQNRNGTVKVLAPARFPEPVLVIGSENWKYRTVNPDGSTRWERQVYHGATATAVGDFNGDGRDELVGGSEYPYGPIFDAAGNNVGDKIVANWTNCALALDLDGDGKKEAVLGRAGHLLDIRTVKRGGSSLPREIVPLGGEPLALAEIPGGGAEKLAVAVSDGHVQIFDGQLRERHFRRFAAPLRGMTVCGDALFALCEDGSLYELDRTARIRRRYPVAWDKNRTVIPQPVSDGTKVAAAAGTSLYFVAP